MSYKKSIVKFACAAVIAASPVKTLANDSFNSSAPLSWMGSGIPIFDPDAFSLLGRSNALGATDIYCGIHMAHQELNDPPYFAPVPMFQSAKLPYEFPVSRTRLREALTVNKNAQQALDDLDRAIALLRVDPNAVSHFPSTHALTCLPFIRIGGLMRVLRKPLKAAAS